MEGIFRVRWPLLPRIEREKVEGKEEEEEDSRINTPTCKLEEEPSRCDARTHSAGATRAIIRGRI